MSVAIRAISRLQDADDINVTLGAGVDEYALCWDNDTAKFVLRTTAGYDHGLLAAGSLSDDDHTQYALLAGRAGGQTLYGGTAANDDITIHGTSDATRTTSYVLLQPSGGNVGIGESAPSQALDLIGSLELQDTTTATAGVIFKGADRFIHNFHHPTGQTQAPTGLNTFIGVNAGNFTTGSTATQVYHASWNTAIGANAMSAVTTGGNNVALGWEALSKLTSGVGNMAIGGSALRDITTANYNVAVGSQALVLNTGSYNIGIGAGVMYSKTTGDNNVGIGYDAGRYQTDGGTTLTGQSQSVYIGASTRGNANAQANVIAIGYQAIGLGANTTVIGNTSTTAATIYGAHLANLTDATTNAIVPMLTLTKNVTSTGVGAAGLGPAIVFQAESTTTDSVQQARIAALWYEATHATFKSDIVAYASDAAGEREIWRGRGNGSAPAIGFLGATPQARIAHVADPAGGATVDAEARSAINSILATLENFGFHATA